MTMRFTGNILLCIAWMAFLPACSSTPRPRTYAATLNKTQLTQWETEQVPKLGLCFDRPSGKINIQEYPDCVLIFLHGVSAHSTFPSDPQYLITLSIKIYSKDYWASERDREERYNTTIEKNIGNDTQAKERLEFKKWAYYSMNPEVTMRERDGERYYRRSFTNALGNVVKISAEYIPRVPEMIVEDDAAIRRIMYSVAPLDAKKESDGR